MKKELALLGPNGRPLRKAPKERVSKAVAQTMFLNEWFGKLASTRLPPLVRAQDPFTHHAWVFAAAMATAVAASQAPFKIMRETDSFMNLFRMKSAHWQGTARRGKYRRAVQRHITISPQKRMLSNALQEDPEHPLVEVLTHPNPYQYGNQLMALTYLWMAVRGESFWVLESEAGESVMPGEIPARIWPLSPDLFTPAFEDGAVGDLVGWYFMPPIYMRRGKFANVRMFLPLTDVIQFKYPNPANPIRGLSKIAAVAMSIETDLLSKEYNRAIIENGGDPGGVLTYDGTLKPEEEEEYLESWENQHKGAKNARRTALLQGGFKYSPIALAPKDIEFLKLLDWDREEILAAMGTSSSVLGAKDVANYAVAQAQDKHFWDKNVIPMLVNIESCLDATLFYEQPDNIVGLHDLADVEALRSGVAEKATMANNLTGQNLHMPPSVAFKIVGLEVEPYEGSDMAVLPPLLVPAKDVFHPEIVPGVPVTPPVSTPAEAPGAPASDPLLDLFKSPELVRVRIRALKSQRWKDFVKVQGVIEKGMRGKYRSWITTEKKDILAWFDKVTDGRSFTLPMPKELGELILAAFKAPVQNLIATLPDIKISKNRLRTKFRPLYTSALDMTFGFTLDDLGTLPVFDISDQRIVQFFNKRENTFVNSTPETIRKSLVQTLSEGLSQGETVQQLRIRVAQVYDIAASSSKALQVARTESGSFMNGVRDVIFDAQGFTEEEWSNAEDEVVRISHQVFGDAGVQPRDFNYLTLVGGEGAGILAFPGDTRCSNLGELLNCRCLKIPVK